MFRQSIALLAIAAALTGAAGAATKKKASPSAAVTAKSATPGDIARALGKDGTVRVIVTVKPLASGRPQLATALRGAATRAAAKQEIAASIQSVLSSVKLSHVSAAKGAPSLIRLTTVPAFSALVDQAELETLAKDKRVLAIEYDRPMKRHLDVTLPLIGMPAVHSMGGIGAGYSIAVIDDGVQRNHEFLTYQGYLRLHPGREGCFLDTNDCPNGTNEQIATGAAAAAAGAEHGTHVAGIALGNRPASAGTPNKGVAPAARLVPINIFGPNSSTSEATVQRAFEYVEDLVMENSGGNPLKIASINMSVGGGASDVVCDSDPDMALLKPVVDNLRSKGVLAAVSAGNDGLTSAMSFPACLSSFVSVAATSRAGAVATYTDISPSTDLFAPGGEIGECVVSSVPGNTYSAKCGTSMAAPHVAGAIAALRQMFPAASACRIEDALKVSGLATADLEVTKPRIRVNQARARLLAPTAPYNTYFSGARTIALDRPIFAVDGTNLFAFREPGEPHEVVSTSSRSVWWKWTPTTDGAVTIDTIGSGFDTVLAVYQGATSATSLGTLVAENDDVSVSEHASSVTFDAAAGATYHILVAGKTIDEHCGVSLNFFRTTPNDNFAQAIVETVTAGQTLSITGNNFHATKETGEPDHNGDAGHTSTVWYSFTAPSTESITIDTTGSTTLTDTVLAVYTGASVDALTQVAVNDDIDFDSANYLSSVTFNMVAGTTYHVAVSGYLSDQGVFQLSFAPAGATCALRASGAARRTGVTLKPNC